MALQRALVLSQELRPVKKFLSGDSLAFCSLVSRFDMAVNDDALDDASRHASASCSTGLRDQQRQ